MISQVTSGSKSRLAALLCLAVLFSLIWGSLAEAAECVQEPVVAVAGSSHADAPADGSGDSRSADKACIHGHCHHTAPAVSQGRSVSEYTVPARIFAVSSPAFPHSRDDDGLKRPPRI